MDWRGPAGGRRASRVGLEVGGPARRARRLAAGAATIALGSLLACQDYYFDYTPNLRVRATALTTAVFNVEPTDVLFVIDNSGSMAEEQDLLIQNTADFIAEMSLSPNDFRIGVISMDPLTYPASPGSERDICCMHELCNDRDTPWPNDCSREGALCNVDGLCLGLCGRDRDCLPGERCDCTGSQCDLGTGRCAVTLTCNPVALDHPNFCDAGRLRSPTGRPLGVAGGLEQWFLSRPADDSEAARAALVAAFQDTVRSLGVRGGLYEAGLQMVWQALDPLGPAHATGHNQGFPRPGADLAIIFVSDEDDCSRPLDSQYLTMQQGDCYDPLTRPQLVSPAALVAQLAALKGDGDVAAGLKRLRGAAILGGVPYNPNLHGPSAPPLDFVVRGCFTQRNIGPSDVCGCWANDQTTAVEAGDLYCQLLCDAPYGQCPQEGSEPPRWPPAAVVGGLGGCLAMPGTRYVEFLTALSQLRVAAGYRSDTLIDSICSENYRQTLIDIVNSVILNNCFALDQQPLDGAASLQVKLNGQVLPLVEPDSGERGWSYEARDNQICLQGGLKKRLNDVFEILIITENTVD